MVKQHEGEFKHRSSFCKYPLNNWQTYCQNPWICPYHIEGAKMIHSSTNLSKSFTQLPNRPLCEVFLFFILPKER
jgi:hypothetical protein